MIAAQQLVCPACRLPLDTFAGGASCAGGHRYEERDGILDLRRPREGVDRALVEFWEGSTEYYERAHELNLAAYVEHPPHARLVEAVADRELVLDVGCGTGDFGQVLAEQGGHRYVGVDVSIRALRGAQAAGVPGAYAAADAEALPFPDETFDAVVTLYALEHFTRPAEALGELARVLRPGGTLGILAMRYDRPLGTIPSIRFGLAGTPRLHPANVAAYAVNRGRFAIRQLAKHLRYAVDRDYAPFEQIERPLVLQGSYEADFDAVHVVSGAAALRTLRRHGIEIVSSNVDERPLRLFAPVGLEVLGRKLPR